MNIIETIKTLEHVGFTRRQAEAQVETMSDLKKDLATKADITAIFTALTAHIAAMNERFIGIDRRFDLIDKRFEIMEKRLDLQDKNIRLNPIITTLYLIGIFLTYTAFSNGKFLWLTLKSLF